MFSFTFVSLERNLLSPFAQIPFPLPRQRGPLPSPRRAAAAPGVRLGGAHAGGAEGGDPLHQRGDGQAGQDRQGRRSGGLVSGLTRKKDVSVTRHCVQSIFDLVRLN